MDKPRNDKHIIATIVFYFFSFSILTMKLMSKSATKYALNLQTEGRKNKTIWWAMQERGLYAIIVQLPYERAHDRTYNKTGVTKKDQPVHLSSTTRVPIYPSLDSPESVEGTWSAKTDQTAHLRSLIRVFAGRMSYCRSCRVLAHIGLVKEYLTIILGYFFLISHRTIRWGYLLEAPQRGAYVYMEKIIPELSPNTPP